VHTCKRANAVEAKPPISEPSEKRVKPEEIKIFSCSDVQAIDRASDFHTHWVRRADHEAAIKKAEDAAVHFACENGKLLRMIKALEAEVKYLTNFKDYVVLKGRSPVQKYSCAINEFGVAYFKEDSNGEFIFCSDYGLLEAQLKDKDARIEELEKMVEDSIPKSELGMEHITSPDVIAPYEIQIERLQAEIKTKTEALEKIADKSTDCGNEWGPICSDVAKEALEMGKEP
jgi:hypothetical protein